MASYRTSRSRASLAVPVTVHGNVFLLFFVPNWSGFSDRRRLHQSGCTTQIDGQPDGFPGGHIAPSGANCSEILFRVTTSTVPRQSPFTDPFTFHLLIYNPLTFQLLRTGGFQGEHLNEFGDKFISVTPVFLHPTKPNSLRTPFDWENHNPSGCEECPGDLSGWNPAWGFHIGQGNYRNNSYDSRHHAVSGGKLIENNWDFSDSKIPKTCRAAACQPNKTIGSGTFPVPSGTRLPVFYLWGKSLERRPLSVFWSAPKILMYVGSTPVRRRSGRIPGLMRFFLMWPGSAEPDSSENKPGTLQTPEHKPNILPIGSEHKPQTNSAFSRCPTRHRAITNPGDDGHRHVTNHCSPGAVLDQGQQISLMTDQHDIRSLDHLFYTNLCEHISETSRFSSGKDGQIQATERISAVFQRST